MNLLKKVLVTCLCACTLVVMTPALTLSISRATGGADGSAVSAETYNKTTGYEYKVMNGLPTLSELKAGYNRYCLTKVGGSTNAIHFFASSRTHVSWADSKSPDADGFISSLGEDFTAFESGCSGFTLVPVYDKGDTDASWDHYVKIQLANGRYLKRTGPLGGRSCTSVPDYDDGTTFGMYLEQGMVYFEEKGIAVAYLGWRTGDTKDDVTGATVTNEMWLDCYSIRFDPEWGHTVYAHFGLFKKVQDTSAASLKFSNTAGEIATYTDNRINSSGDKAYFYLPCWVKTGSDVTLTVTPKKPWASSSTVTFKCPDAGNTPTKVYATVRTSDGYSTTREYRIYKKDHNYDLTKEVVIKAPTCTETGIKGYKCTEYSKCGAYIESSKIDSLGGHAWGEWKSDGAQTHTRKCTRGDASQTENHDWGSSYISVAPTYFSAGERTWRCTKCRETRTESIPKLVDNAAPSLSASFAGKSWNSFAAAAGTMIKTTASPVINVTASDGDSGLKSVQYLNSNTQYGTTASLPTTGWYDISLNSGKGSITTWTKGVHYIYLKAVDNVGHVSYVRIDPIAIYGQSSLINKTDEFFPDGPDNIVVNMKLNMNTVDKITNGKTSLVKGTDYTVDEAHEKVTLSSKYLASALAGNISKLDLVFSFNMLGIAGTSGDMNTGAFTVTKHIHNYVYDKVDKTQHTKRCADCGKRFNETHTWDAGKVTTPATYLSDGEKTYSCIYCGETRTEVVPALTDSIKPTLTASIGVRSWDSFGKTGSNMMFASAPAISVSAADGESGLKSVQYLNSSTGYDSQAALPTEGWKDVDLTEGKGTITAKSQGIQYIYLKAIDKQNNVTCVKIDPVVVYGQSSLKTAAAEFDLDAQADIDVTMDLNGNTLSSIKNGSSVLKEGTDYTVDGSKVTLSRSYLADRLASADSLALSFSFDPQGITGSEATLEPSTFTVTKHKTAVQPVNNGTGSNAAENNNAGNTAAGSSGSGSGSATATVASSSTSGGAAQTGDESGIFIWIMLLGLAGASAAAAYRKYRKE